MEHGARPMRSTRRLSNTIGHRPAWYNISNSVAGQPTQVSIYDEIGFFGVDPGQFMADLKGVNGDIEMHINSPGGDVHGGIAIYNQLKQRKGNVHVIVDGLAASAASFIAMAASPGQLEMAPHSQMMIHNGFSMVIGDADDLRKTADLLDMVTNEIASIYSERSGKPVDYWLGKMSAETWLTDKQTVAEGLADGIHGESSAKNAWDLSVYAKAPVIINADGGWVQRDGKWVFDPDNDGDDDSTAEGDTDHDYFDADGKQIKSIPPDPDGKQGKPMPGNKWHAHLSNAADKYKQADRDRMAKSGEAMPDGSYPVADGEDLDNAIHAVGRGNADHDDIRSHIIKRAKALGLESKIPDNWNADGSIKSLIDVGALSAFLTTHMAHERSRS